MSHLAVGPEPFDGPDVQALLDALADELDERYGGDDPTYRTEVSAAQFSPPGGRFLVGRVGGEAVACGGVRRLEPGVGEIKRMYVRPDHRGRGLSRPLLAALEDAARDLGYATVRLETGEPQHEAVGLYESSGYHRIRPYGRYAWSPVNLCFEKAVG